jgi:hypothetical protein
MDEGTQASPLTEDQITQMKVAILEALKESGEVGEEASDKRIMENKVGTMEALKESGLADKIQGPIADNPETAPIPYKDAPEDIKRQMEQQAGFSPSTMKSPIETQTETKVAETLIKAKQASQSAVQGDRSQELAERQLQQASKEKLTSKKK